MTKENEVLGSKQNFASKILNKTARVVMGRGGYLFDEGMRNFFNKTIDRESKRPIGDGNRFEKDVDKAGDILLDLSVLFKKGNVEIQSTEKSLDDAVDAWYNKPDIAYKEAFVKSKLPTEEAFNLTLEGKKLYDEKMETRKAMDKFKEAMEQARKMDAWYNEPDIAYNEAFVKSKLPTEEAFNLTLEGRKLYDEKVATRKAMEEFKEAMRRAGIEESTSTSSAATSKKGAPTPTVNVSNAVLQKPSIGARVKGFWHKLTR